MSKIKSLKVGSVLSESSYFVVRKVTPAGVEVTDEYGNNLEIGNEYVEKVLVSADHYETTEDKTITELGEIFLQNPNVVMTVGFYKKDTPKTAKKYKEELNVVVDKIRNAKVSEIESLVIDAIENPVSKVIAGELREMKGRHYGHKETSGRVNFIDMEIAQDLTKNDDVRLRQVDPRTIQFIILKGVKYKLKK